MTLGFQMQAAAKNCGHLHPQTQAAPLAHANRAAPAFWAGASFVRRSYILVAPVSVSKFAYALSL